MFADFLKNLIQPEPPQLDLHDAQLALTALLVRLARSDGHYEAGEVTRITRIIQSRYGLSPAEAEKLRGAAEQLEAEAPDTHRFTNAIKQAVAYEDRLSVVEALWQVALADGKRDHQEDALIRMVSAFLGVNDRDSALARQRMTPRE